jgi:hypothetical protein
VCAARQQICRRERGPCLEQRPADRGCKHCHDCGGIGRPVSSLLRPCGTLEKVEVWGSSLRAWRALVGLGTGRQDFEWDNFFAARHVVLPFLQVRVVCQSTPHSSEPPPLCLRTNISSAGRSSTERGILSIRIGRRRQQR